MSNLSEIKREEISKRYIPIFIEVMINTRIDEEALI